MYKIADYIFEKCIGKSSYGEVYLTSRKGEQKKYATKVCERAEIDNGDYLRNYLSNYIMALKYLNHPNIIKFQDCKKTKRHYYMMMEYCNGGNLSKTLQKYIDKNGKAFPEEIIQHLMKQIIDAFKYIHEKKIIHRNINLENILLHYDNEEDEKNLNLLKAQIKIIDFGFSCTIIDNELKYIIGNPIRSFLFICGRGFNDITKKLGYNETADIWSIYNQDNQDLLTSISGSQFIKPIDKKEEEDFKNNIKRSIVQLPFNFIPDNPINENIPVMSKEELYKMQQESNNN